MGESEYSRLMRRAEVRGAGLTPRQRAAAAAVCADRAYAALGDEHPLAQWLHRALEATWLSLETGKVTRDELKVWAFELSEALDETYSDLSGVERYVVRTVAAALDSLEADSSEAELAAAVDGLANVIDNVLTESEYEAALAAEWEWLNVVLERCEGTPDAELRRVNVSWPRAEAPRWLVRALHKLETDDEDPASLANESLELPQVLAKQSEQRARKFADSRKGRTFAPWREPTGLPEGMTQRRIGRGRTASEGNIVTSGYDRYGLVREPGGQLLFAPPGAVALGMSADERFVYSWRVEHGAGSGIARGHYVWSLERYAWPTRKRVDRYTITSQSVIAWCWPDALHVSSRQHGELLVLKCRSEDYERKIYVAYDATGARGEALEEDEALALLAASPVESAGVNVAETERWLTRLEAEEDAESQAPVLLDALFSARSQEFAQRSSCREQLPQALAVLDLAAARESRAAPVIGLSTRVARYLKAVGDLARAEPLARRALDLSEQRWGEQHAELLAPLSTLGDVLVVSQRSEEAVPLLERALELAREHFGGNSAEMATALTGLGEAYFLEDRQEETSDLMRRSLELRRALFPAPHAELGIGLNDLGTVISEAEPEEAEALLREALAVRRATHDEPHPDLAVTLDNLGSLLDEQERAEEALEVTQEAVSIFEQCYGPHHPDVAIALGNMAIRLKEMQRPAEAASYYERALAAVEEVFGVHSLEAAKAQRALGVCLHELKQNEAASTCFRCAVAIRESEESDTSLELARDLNWLATALEGAKEPHEAEGYYRRALQIVEARLESPHERIGLACHNLAHLLKLIEEHAEAKQLYQRALQNYEGALGEDDPKVATTCNLFAQLLYAMKDWSEAEAYARRALRIDALHYGEEHTELVGSLLWLGRSLGEQQRWDEAEAQLRHALAIDETAHDADSEDIRIDLKWLADLLRKAGRWPLAEPVQQRLLTVCEALYGRSHARVAAAAAELGTVLLELGDLEGAESHNRRALEIYQQLPRRFLPELQRAHERMAQILTRSGRVLEAEPHYARASELASEDEQSE